MLSLHALQLHFERSMSLTQRFCLGIAFAREKKFCTTFEHFLSLSHCSSPDCRTRIANQRCSLHRASPVFMRVSRYQKKRRHELTQLQRIWPLWIARTRRTRVIEMRNRMLFFCLTIYFDDSIQRTNCDDVMSQCSIERWKGRIENMATKKKAKPAKKAAKKKKK